MTGLAIFIRAVHLGALTLLVGAFVFLLLVARPAFKKSGPESTPAFERFDRLLLRLAVGSLLVTLASGMGWLAVQAVIMTGRPLGQALTLDTIGSVLAGTQFGRVWQFRLILVALLGGFLLLREWGRDDRDWLALRLEGAMLGGSLIATLAWVGHAVVTEGGARLLHLAASSVHLLAAGIWLGGLLPLFLLLSRARTSLNPSWNAIAREATRRFSTLGLVSVGSLILTGAVIGWILVGGFPALVGTLYGRLLLLKLGLFSSMIGIATVNRLRLKPQLLAARTLNSGGTVGDLLRRLRRNALAEACLGTAILYLAGALGVTPPGRHVQPAWPFPFRLSWEANRDAPEVWLWIIGGSVLALIGLAALRSVWAGRLRPQWTLLPGLAATGYGLWLALSPLAIDAYPTTYLRPAVPYHALSIANGARLYLRHCAACHGVAGYGDGPAAAGLARTPADLTAKHTADHTAGDLSWWLSNGIKGSSMPGFKDRLSEEERWDLVNFLRAMGSAERARAMGPLVQPNPWLVAPDFTFGVGTESSQTLKDHRGWAIVHLVLFALPGSLPRLQQLDASWNQIRRAGARILAVPMGDPTRIYRELGARVMNLPLLVERSPEIVETYTLFRRTLAAKGAPPAPSHMEFLIDRQGYIRARWIPGEGQGWAEIPRLLYEVGWLNNESLRAPAAVEHVH